MGAAALRLDRRAVKQLPLPTGLAVQLVLAVQPQPMQRVAPVTAPMLVDTTGDGVVDSAWNPPTRSSSVVVGLSALILVHDGCGELVHRPVETADLVVGEAPSLERPQREYERDDPEGRRWHAPLQQPSQRTAARHGDLVRVTVTVGISVRARVRVRVRLGSGSG